MNKKQYIFLFVLSILGNVATMHAQQTDTTHADISMGNNSIRCVYIIHIYQPTGLIEYIELKNKKYINNENILTQRGNLHLRSNGTGSLATLTIRGSSPSQTSFVYNNFSLANPMLGLTDVSLLPISFFNSVEINPNSESAIGGSVGLKSTINNENETEVNVQVGSANKFQIAFNNQIINKRFKHKTAYFFLVNENKYEYDYKQQTLKTENATVKQYGIMHETKYQKNNFSTALNLWYQSADRQITKPYNQNSGNNSQYDSQIKIMSNSYLSIKRKTLELGAMAALTKLNFNNVDANEYSKSTANEGQVYFKISEHFLNKWLWRSEAQLHFITAQSKHYYTTPQIIRKKIIGGAERTYVRNSYQGELAVIHDQKLYWQGFAKVIRQYTKSNKYRLETEIGINKNIRLPYINERYWEFSGDRNLAAERAFGGQGGFAIYKKNDSKNEPITNKYLSFYGYYKHVIDWISWIPSSGIWVAKNMKTVNSKGFDASITPIALYGKNSANFWLQPSFKYSYNATRLANSNNQLIYTPQHRYTGNVVCKIKKWELNLTHGYTSKSYTTSDNSFAVDGFNTIDCGISKVFETYKSNIILQLSCFNLLNNTYQTIPFYLMPPRTFELSFTLKI